MNDKSFALTEIKAGQLGYKHRSIGEFSAWFRSKHGYSAADMAKTMKVSRQYIAQIEDDKNLFPANYCKDLYKMLNAEEKKMMIDALSISIQDLLEGKRERDGSE